MWKEGILSAIDSLILTTNSAFILTLSRFQVKEQFEGQSAVNIAWSTMDSAWYGGQRLPSQAPPNVPGRVALRASGASTAIPK
jgi:hypothetical protein